MQEFEVRLISIDWECPNRVRAIVPAKEFLEASLIDGSNYEYDVVLYNKEDGLFFQFAIKTKLTPILKTKDGSWDMSNRLCNIKDDFWIIKGDWRTGSRGIGYHHCPSINTIGKIQIGISQNLEEILHFVTIDINSNISDFDFTQLKNDFEGELWNLITSNKSNVSAKNIEIRYCEKIFRFAENKSITEFLKAFDQVARNPKRELSQTKGLRKTEKVIPISETYRKISTAGLSAMLPSKTILENHDVYENRFICFMLHSIYLIVSKNVKYSSLPIERLEKEIETLSQKMTILEDPDPKVNHEEIEKEILFQERRVNEIINHWKSISDGLAKFESDENKVIKIKIKYAHNSENTFWCRTQEFGFCLIKFPATIVEFISEETEFIFHAVIKFNGRVMANSGKEHPAYTMISARKIADIELLNERKVLKRQKENKSILEQNQWSQISILNSKERTNFQDERINQLNTLRKQIERLNYQIKNIGQFNNEQSELLPFIEQRLKTPFFRNVKWRKFQGFKPSMTFIQNVSYRNAMRFYKEVLKSEGIDVEVFELYENVTSFGMREMPQVYELWCLVMQIKVLQESFGFMYSKNDVTNLLRNVDPKKQNIVEYSKITFAESLGGRNVILHYQKSDLQNRRPDFILEISCNKRKIYLVLDSKFKNYSYKKSIIYDSIAMKNKYGDRDNFVFILHPCKDGVFEGRNVKYTNHGGERIFFKENQGQKTKFPCHEYGYIELKPNHTDALKKLIGMGFEYLLESSRNARHGDEIDPKPETPMFCLNCGGSDISMDKYPRGKKRSYYSCTCNDSNCGHKIHIDYCWNCQTKLFKHGSYWDYHLESAWSIFDIRCPQCGMTLGDRPPN